jgi:hypothetical protein
VVLDEAHDAFDSAADVFFQMVAYLPGLMLCDPLQEIYSFAHPGSDMRHFLSTPARLHVMEHALTTTFRFGPSLSLAAVNMLERLGIPGIKIKSGAKRDTYLSRLAWGELRFPLAVVARRHSSLFKTLQTLFLERPDVQSVKFAGDPDLYLTRLAQMRKASAAKELEAKRLEKEQREAALAAEKAVARKDFKRARGEETVVESDKAIIRAEQGAKLFGKTWTERRENLERLEAAMDAKVTRPGALADVVISTVHQAKGLEWDYVLLCEGFFQRSRTPSAVNEKHVAYVALTRARKHCWIECGNLAQYVEFTDQPSGSEWKRTGIGAGRPPVRRRSRSLETKSIAAYCVPKDKIAEHADGAKSSLPEEAPSKKRKLEEGTRETIVTAAHPFSKLFPQLTYKK